MSNKQDNDAHHEHGRDALYTETYTVNNMYTSKHVTELLSIASSTLRTYCLRLSAAGYDIRRDENGNRVFTNEDIFNLTKMREMINTGMTRDNAAKLIKLNKSSQDMTPSVTESDVQESHELLLIEQGNMKEQLEEIQRDNRVAQNETLKELQEMKAMNEKLMHKLDDIVDKKQDGFIKRLFKRG